MRRLVGTALAGALVLSAMGSPALAGPEPAERSVSVRPAARQADIPMSHVWQSLNNCGPASVTMILSSMNIRTTQEAARIPLRGIDERRGMGTGNLEPWVNSQFGIHAFSRNNGTSALMKTLITNGFAPMVTQWLDDYSRISHWRVVRGYDDNQATFYVSDPMRGANVPLSYEWFDKNWRPFQYRYAVLYRVEDTDLLRSIVGNDWFDVPARFNFLARAREEAAHSTSYEAWFTYGEAAYQAGRATEAVAAFEKGMAFGSATGIFNVRNSYPAALRLLGREAEARTISARLGSTNGATAGATAPTAEEIRYIQTLIGGQPVTAFRNEFDGVGTWLANRSAGGDPLRAE